VNAPPDDDDRVGYGHPPKKTRWKKRKSGNPNRRLPKRTHSTVETIDRLFQSLVEITINGETTKVPVLEAILHQVSLQEMQGRGRAHRVRLKYQEFAIQTSERKTEIIFEDNDYTRALAKASPIGSDDYE
jgi:hypothetical protein